MSIVVKSQFPNARVFFSLPFSINIGRWRGQAKGWMGIVFSYEYVRSW
jgi:hypothetical protein